MRWSCSSSNFYALIGQNLKSEFMPKIYAASWNLFSTLTAVSTCDVFKVLSFSTGCTKWNTAAIKSLLLFMASLSIVFLLRKVLPVKVRNLISDGMVFVFHLAWCERGFKSLNRFWPYLIAFSGATSWMVGLSNYCIWYLFFNIYFHEVEHSLCGMFMHVCKIWDNDLTYNPGQIKVLGTVLQYSYFSVISPFPLKTGHIFRKFHAVLPPPHPIQSWNSKKLDTRVQHCLWAGGRGWTCVTWKTPQKNKCPKTFVHDCSIRFNISLQNFKKHSDIFSRKKRSEEYLVINLDVERKHWAISLPQVHLSKKETQGGQLKT